MRRLIIALLLLIPAGCQLDSIGLELAPGWNMQSLIVWRQAHPNMMALSKHGRWLYISCATDAHHNAPSLAAYDFQNARKLVLITGLQRADGLKFAPDGSLWLGEAYDRGMIWRIAEADKLPPEQFIDRERPGNVHPAITNLTAAGIFSHAGIAFSQDKHYAYLADTHEQGSLYRMHLRNRTLEVLHADKGWLNIELPEQARSNARVLHARIFNRIRDMETLPDGRILLAETGSGHILVLDDRGKKPDVQLFMKHAELQQPDNLAWDNTRQWLWLTDDSKPSVLWAWDGHHLIRIATHHVARITGVLVHDNNVLINLQNRSGGAELTLKLYPQQESM